MQIIIAPDRPQLGDYIAAQAAIILKQRLSQQPSVNLVVATGSSQFEVLGALVQYQDLDWGRVHGFHLDEYLGVASNHPASFCGYLQERFVSRVPLASFHYLDGTLSADELKRTADAKLKGQPIDLMLCGIGENGHLAFNDPPADFQAEDPYLIVQLDEACRRQQVGEGWFDSLDGVPTQAISMSIRQIMRAKTILCTVPDSRKAQAVRDAVEGSVTPQVPASILQDHADVLLALDAGSSSLLDPTTLARCHRIGS